MHSLKHFPSRFYQYYVRGITGFFSVSSHIFGDNSPLASVVSQILETLLNLIMAAVCIGYIAQTLQLILPFLPVGVIFGLSVFLLGCAIPFELLNTGVQNDKAGDRVREGAWPISSQIFAYVSTVFGAVQYLIRNFNLVMNFARTSIGALFLRNVSKGLGFAVTSSRFAIIGGVVGFGAHMLLAFTNWDKYINRHASNKSLQMVSWTFWGGVATYLLMQGMLPIVMLPYMAVLGGIGLLGYRYLPLRRIKQLWLSTAWITLPFGALLYTLVDFYNSYAIVSRLGWLNTYTAAACLGFGVFSLINVAMIWGYNTVRCMKGSAQRYPLFEKWYFTDASVRRVSSFVKEILLCGLDLLNNRLALPMVNYVLASVLGITVGLPMLNLCTIFYAINRLVVLSFQSRDDSVGKGLESTDFKNTWLASGCQRLCSVFSYESEHVHEKNASNQELGDKLLKTA